MPSKPGRKPGPGLPKGYKFQHTLERETARRHFEGRILAELDPLIDAQLDLSKGLMVMFSREKDKDGKRTGRMYRVVNPEEMLELLNGKNDQGKDNENGEEYYYLSAKDPDQKMLDSLMNRVFGRPKETLEVQPGESVTVLDIIKALEPDQRIAAGRALLRGEAIDTEAKRLM